ncbi:MAG: helix-turn-helix domain-containing protein [Terriglobia bacterium]|nr:helix-turn-helix domain-containing protein [Terriglobia bacterium]
MSRSSDSVSTAENSGLMPELLTAKELEALLKIDVKTIYSYVQRGLIPYVRIQSNVRFVKHQIFDWIEERNYRPRPLNGRKAN